MGSTFDLEVEAAVILQACEPGDESYETRVAKIHQDLRPQIEEKAPNPMPPEICPQCGALVPDRAKACPECGSCEETGWSDDSAADRLGIPRDSFDYNQYLQEEFGPPSSPSTFRKWIIPAVIILLALLFLLGIIVF